MTWLTKKRYDMVHGLKIYKIPDEVIKFTEKTMETCWVELIAGGKSLAEVKIQRGIFQGDTLSPLLFVIAIMSLNHILRKFTAWYKLSKSQEKINHLMYMDDIKQFAKNGKELETLIRTVRIYSQGIEMWIGIDKYTMLVMTSGKLHMTEGIELLNQEKIRMLWEKGTYKHLGILKADTIKQVEMKEKKSISCKPECCSRKRDLIKEISPPRKILGIIFKLDKRTIQTNRPEKRGRG